MIYVPPGQDFFCVEPVSHVNDGFNMLERGVEGTGVRVLAPGQTLRRRDPAAHRVTMPAGQELPVLVVGAGPTGLAAALELARQGQAVRIVDQNATRSENSKAIGVNARTLELMEPSGVTERLLAAGLRLRRFNFRSAERLLATIDLGRVQHRYDFHAGAAPGRDRAHPRAAPGRARHPGRVVDRVHRPRGDL